jgi:hypothetical protein
MELTAKFLVTLSQISRIAYQFTCKPCTTTTTSSQTVSTAACQYQPGCMWFSKPPCFSKFQQPTFAPSIFQEIRFKSIFEIDFHSEDLVPVTHRAGGTLSPSPLPPLLHSSRAKFASWLMYVHPSPLGGV